MDDMSNRALLERIKQLETRIAALEKQSEPEPAPVEQPKKLKKTVLEGIPE